MAGFPKISRKQANRDRPLGKAALLVGLLFSFALLTPLWQVILNTDPYQTDLSALDFAGNADPVGSFGGMSFAHPLGVEPQTGRDVLLRLSSGMRTSILISLAAAFLSALIGVTVGLISGYFGGRLDNILNRVIDVLVSIPLIFFALAAVPVMQIWLSIGNFDGTNLQRIPILIIILSLFGWPDFARVVRSEVKVVTKSDYVSAALVAGAKNRYVIARHLLPQVQSTIMAIFLISFVSFIKIEASLTLLGAGVIEPLSSWGTMISLAPQYIVSSPTYVAIVAISLICFTYATTRLVDEISQRNQRLKQF